MSMTVEEMTERLASLPKLARRLDELEAEVKRLKGVQATYRYRDLRDRGYGHNEAYAILHSYGYKREGAWRVRRDALDRYESGE